MAKVLIIDDEDSLRAAIVTALEMRGHQVFSTASGAEALRILAKEKIDRVISDVRMPELSGIELLKKIQKLPGTKPKIYFMTGYADLEEAEALKIGAAGIIAKPFKMKDLIQAIGI